MDFGKFSRFLLVIALFGLVWSYGAYSSTFPQTFAARKFYAQEHEDESQARWARLKSMYTDREAMHKGQEIAEAQASRRDAGKTGAMVFGGLAVLAIGIRLSARPAVPGSTENKASAVAAD
ncbi:MAG: hypothetical protein CL725_08885 [Chloroflexi bacterium]|nr:hypothetical protein [Chloroflexota bacterium]|tara:strand:+ start:1929 stop:2291 length:363 start_codon:yes stop_codon:yes gene_type:complete